MQRDGLYIPMQLLKREINIFKIDQFNVIGDQASALILKLRSYILYDDWNPALLYSMIENTFLMARLRSLLVDHWNFQNALRKLEMHTRNCEKIRRWLRLTCTGLRHVSYVISWLMFTFSSMSEWIYFFHINILVDIIISVLRIKSEGFRYHLLQ